jgi:hypothetical protein
MLKRVFSPFVFLLLMIASNAQATSIYQYTGNPFDTFIDNGIPSGSYTTDMRVTGSFTVSEPLAANLPLGTDISGLVLEASLNDGRQTWTPADSLNIPILEVGTDALANITTWSVSFGSTIFISNLFVVSGIETISTPLSTTDGGANFLDIGNLTPSVGDAAQVTSNPGMWTLIPEPSTALLLSIGLLGLAKRRR